MPPRRLHPALRASHPSRRSPLCCRDRISLLCPRCRLRLRGNAPLIGAWNHAVPSSPNRKKFSDPLQPARQPRDAANIGPGSGNGSVAIVERGSRQAGDLKFVHATTDPSSPSLVPPLDRIATFDQDGTLWVEHPLYSQVVYCLDRVAALVKANPELADVEPFKTVLSGDREAIAKLPKDDLIKVLAATLTGMSVDSSKPKRKSGLSRPRTRAGSDRTPSWSTCR